MSKHVSIPRKIQVEVGAGLWYTNIKTVTGIGTLGGELSVYT
jgi:hypothetical protein